MRVLVTGGHGFVGSHLVERLLARGDRVRCLLRRPGLPDALRGRDVDVVRGDVRDAAAVARAVEGMDEVYHLAALTRSTTRRAMLRTNAGGTRNLLDAAVRAGLPGRFLFCSSIAAVGPSPEDRPLDETDPCRPVTWYGESKHLAERSVCASAARLATTILRPPAVYGPRDRDFLPVFRAAAYGLRPVLGDRPRRYHFVYAEDLAEAMVTAARAASTRGRTYFVTHDEVLTPACFVAHAARAVGRPGPPWRIPDSVLTVVAHVGDLAAQVTGRPPLLNGQRMRELAGRAYLACADALERDTGFRARVGAAEGARRTANWYRDEGWIRRGGR